MSDSSQDFLDPLDPKPDPLDSPDSPEDGEPDTVATPEGDNETAPDEPLAPAEDGLQTPRGNAPSDYETDKTKPHGVEKFIDEVVRGEYM